MTALEDDPIVGRFFDTAEKKAKWLFRLKIGYILWIIFMIIGIVTILIWYALK